MDNIFESIINKSSIEELHKNINKRKETFPNENILKKLALARRSCNVCLLIFNELLEADLSRRSELYEIENDSDTRFTKFLKEQNDRFQELRVIQDKLSKEQDWINDLILIYTNNVMVFVKQISLLKDHRYQLSLNLQNYCLIKIFFSLHDLFSGKNEQEEKIKKTITRLGINIATLHPAIGVINVLLTAASDGIRLLNNEYSKVSPFDLHYIDSFNNAAFKWSVTAKSLADLYRMKMDGIVINSENLLNNASKEIRPYFTE